MAIFENTAGDLEAKLGGIIWGHRKKMSPCHPLWPKTSVVSVATEKDLSGGGIKLM